MGLHLQPGRGRDRPGHHARAGPGDAEAHPGSPWPDLYRAAGVRAVSDGGRHHGLGLRRVRRALVHRRAPPGHRAGGRVHPVGRPDRALLGGEPSGRTGVPRARPRPAGALGAPRYPPNGPGLPGSRRRPAAASNSCSACPSASTCGSAIPTRSWSPPRTTSWPSWSGGGWPRSSVGRPGRSSRRAPVGGTTTSPHPRRQVAPDRPGTSPPVGPPGHTSRRSNSRRFPSTSGITCATTTTSASGYLQH